MADFSRYQVNLFHCKLVPCKLVPKFVNSLHCKLIKFKRAPFKTRSTVNSLYCKRRSKSNSFHTNTLPIQKKSSECVLTDNIKTSRSGVKSEWKLITLKWWAWYQLSKGYLFIWIVIMLSLQSVRYCYTVYWRVLCWRIHEYKITWIRQLPLINLKLCMMVDLNRYMWPCHQGVIDALWDLAMPPYNSKIPIIS